MVTQAGCGDEPLPRRMDAARPTGGKYGAYGCLQYYFARTKWWQKPLWRLKDYLDPRICATVARVLDEFNPDYINLHLLQGIGYNVVREIGTRGIPSTFFLHDLGLMLQRPRCLKPWRDYALENVYKFDQDCIGIKCCILFIMLTNWDRRALATPTLY
jgi:hypothetical protein